MAPRAVRRRIPVALASAAIVVLAAGAACDGGASSGTTDRQARVEERGAEVMPFDQDRTTHIFHATPTGGVQTVVARRPNDSRQITLVRAHLRAEAERFARGDFADPMAIHGMKMPGIDELRRHAGDISVRYSSVPRGARITYRTAAPALIDALHEWFDAQLMDHGTHAHD
jgi:hypothetical protein